MDKASLEQFETLCVTIYTSPNAKDRSDAQQAVLCLQSRAEHIVQCHHILDNSTNPYALVVAATSMLKLVTSHWNSFTEAQRYDIRNYVLSYLISNGPSIKDFVTKALIQLVCRITNRKNLNTCAAWR